MLSGGFRLWSGSATWDLPRRNRFKVLAAGPAAGPEPGSNFERPGSPADSLLFAVVVDDDDDVAARASPVDDDDRAADGDATATSDCREGSTTIVDVAADVVAVVVAADIDMDIGIGTATGTGIDIGDWAGVFGAALPGPAVPYRWDDMYHQKPGLAVCLHVQYVVHSSHVTTRLQPATLFLSSCSFASEPTTTVRVSLSHFFLSFSSRGNVRGRRS